MYDLEALPELDSNARAARLAYNAKLAAAQKGHCPYCVGTKSKCRESRTGRNDRHKNHRRTEAAR